MPFVFLEIPGEDIFRRQARYERELEYYNSLSDPTRNHEAKEAAISRGVLPPAPPDARRSGFAGDVELKDGTAVVLTPYFQANIVVQLSHQHIKGTPGFLSITNPIPGVGFDIISSSAEDQSVVTYELLVDIAPDVETYS